MTMHIPTSLPIKELMAAGKAFYVVWNPNHGQPTKGHLREIDATAEAERLAKLAEGQQFLVLKTISVSQTKTVETRVL